MNNNRTSPKKIDCTIIIVTYNAKEYALNCLKSIYEHTRDVTFEVIVSDNGSTDGLLDEVRFSYPQVKLIENQDNIGFGAANNRGLDAARGRYILYLNEDTVLKNNAVKTLVHFWDSHQEKNIGALGCYLKNENDEIFNASAVFPTYVGLLLQMLLHLLHDIYLMILIKSGLRKHHKPLRTIISSKRGKESTSRVKRVDFICGADLFLKNDENARFDERFFLYFEETDLQLRLKKKGLHRLLIPRAEILHFGSGTQKTGKDEIMLRQIFAYQLSSVLYAKKNLNSNARLLKAIIYVNWMNPLLRIHPQREYYIKQLSRL